MGEIRGITSKEEFELYNGAKVAMLDAGNDAVSSGGMTGGEGYFEWSLSWNSAGFIGVTWTIDGVDFQEDIENGTFDKDKFGLAIASNALLISRGCAEYHLNASKN